MAPLAFSIITPTLNAERYLDECLRSVRDQAMPALEHIVVDGGSTDRTEAIVRAAEVVWFSRPGLNQAAAINDGFRGATGEVLAWLNADDLYVPGALERVQRIFFEHAEADALFGDCDVVDSNGKLLSRLSPGPYCFDRLLRSGNSVAQPAVFLRKRALEHVGLLDETLEYGMDYDLWLRLRNLHIAYTPQVLAAFRWHSDSKTATNVRGNWSELLQIVRRHGGGWTPGLMWSYLRANLTLAQQRVGRKSPRRPR